MSRFTCHLADMPFGIIIWRQMATTPYRASHVVNQAISPHRISTAIREKAECMGWKWK